MAACATYLAIFQFHCRVQQAWMFQPSPALERSREIVNPNRVTAVEAEIARRIRLKIPPLAEILAENVAPYGPVVTGEAEAGASKHLTLDIPVIFERQSRARVKRHQGTGQRPGEN